MTERAKIITNFSDAETWYLPSIPVIRLNQTHDYLIITTNAIESSSTKLTDFVSYLANQGHLPLVITEDEFGNLTGQSPNGTAEKIREWLKNNYIASSIEYVLLIGNSDPGGDVPMKMCWPRSDESTNRETPTDYFYANLTGNWDQDGDGFFGEYSDDRKPGGVDFMNDVYVGRTPVYSGVADLDSVLAKFITYGNELDLTWRQNALLPLSFSDSSTDGAHMGEAMKSTYLTPAGYSSWSLYMQGSVCAGGDSSFASNEELLSGATKKRWMGNPYGMVWWRGHGSQTGAYMGIATAD